MILCTACGENPNRENDTSSDKTATKTKAIFQTTNEENEAPALTEQKPKDTAEIETHDNDSEYFMPDYPYSPEAFNYNVFDKVLYFETDGMDYDKKARFIKKMQDDRLVKDLGSEIYGFVMGGGTVWKKHQFSMLTSQ